MFKHQTMTAESSQTPNYDSCAASSLPGTRKMRHAGHAARTRRSMRRIASAVRLSCLTFSIWSIMSADVSPVAQAQSTPDAPSTAEAPDAPTPDDPSTSDAPTSQPPAGVVRMARAGWDTGWFQAEVYRLLLQRLGYRVDGPHTMDNADFYEAVAGGDVDLWPNGWFPLHDHLIDGSQVEAIGFQVAGGALQGYFADAASAGEHGIENLGDLSAPEVAALFDHDDDGHADLIGCNPGWSCAEAIDGHITAFGLQDRVRQVKGDYSPLMAETLARHRRGEPVLFYTWTPNWTVGELEPGEDVVWLEVPADAGGPAADPSGAGDADSSAATAGSDHEMPSVPGCASDPCRVGWTPNDIRAVANTGFLDANPPVRRLLEQVAIPLEDILEQNARMVDGEGDIEDIAQHAEEWLADNEPLVRHWIDTADPDAVPYSPGTGSADASRVPRVLTVAARALPPFVLYENRRFSGFEVELMRDLAARAGMTAEFRGADTAAKQLDDLMRGAADAALGGMAITGNREAMVDFTLPVLESGLTIMVPVTGPSGLRQQIGHKIRSFLSALADSDLLWLLGVFALVVLFAAHVIWWIERRDNHGFARPYLSGIWDSFYWSVVTMSTVGYGDKVPKAGAGRAFSLLWIICGTLVFAALTASIASSLAVSRLTGGISGPDDLHGRRVATVEGTKGEAYLSSAGIGPVLVADVHEAYDLLYDGDVDAVVFDAPVLDYHVISEGGGRVATAGPGFEHVHYGIAVPEDDSELHEQLNRALLEMVESGDYRRLRDRWFGGG